MSVLSKIPSSSPEEHYADLISGYQGRLYAYIRSLLGADAGAKDVLQETNLVLWRKAQEFELGSNFKAWAFRIAHFQVLAHRQKARRDRLVFDGEVVELLEKEASRQDEFYERRLKVLRFCMEKLSPKLREVLRAKYFEGSSVEGLAKRHGVKANAVSQWIFRAKAQLMKCVQHSTAGSDVGR